MYKNILIPLENSSTDDVILAHVRPLISAAGARVVLVHVADGFVARNQEQLNLSDSEEIISDRAYLEKRQRELAAIGVAASWILRCGDPAEQILTVADQEQCDLIAMATHGHKLLSDIVFGSVAEKLRHATSIPILMIRAPAG